MSRRRRKRWQRKLEERAAAEAAARIRNLDRGVADRGFGYDITIGGRPFAVQVAATAEFGPINEAQEVTRFDDLDLGQRELAPTAGSEELFDWARRVFVGGSK